MRPLELRLWEILHRSGKGVELSADDIAFAEQCLDDNAAQIQANACEVLCRYSSSESARRRAVNRIADLCLNFTEEDYAITILTVMLYLSQDTLLNARVLGDFAFKCAYSSRWQIRTNAVSVLHRFVKIGNTDALNLIKTLSNDPNNYVRANAQHVLQRIGEH